ncbi:type II toxin-antitoxin system RelE/ParE family toxin [Candidatus Woesearchaeota archaeon]|nr:type II toxin-antitoxin system RelE/ParE family toxin [Candidatus Woesearchaeota archaeon]
MFDIFFGPQSEKFLRKSEKELRERIWSALEELQIDPFPKGVKKVLGKTEKVFRIRVGKYRIQYCVFQEKMEILIFDIDRRENAYDSEGYNVGHNYNVGN